MSFITATEIADQRSVGMGQIAVARRPAFLTAVLGSCVGVALYHARLQVGALAHVVLPTSHDRGGQPGKFADTAIPAMLAMLQREGALASGLVAKIAGGACMFGAGGPLQIGDANARAVQTVLEAAGVHVLAKDLGGTSGRRMQLDCATGKVTVSSTGAAARTL